MKICWSPQAKKEYEKILSYLNESWSLREIENFVIKTGEKRTPQKRFL
jgi:plasmid stabilization system protein ParE